MEKNKSEIEMAPKIPEKYLNDFSLIKQVKILATNEIVDVYQVTVFNECNRLASVFTSKGIFNGYDVEIVDKNKEILDVVKQMITDGQISQEIAESYFPELKKRNEYEEIRLILRDLIYGSHSSSFPMKGYSKEQILNWLSKQTLQEWTKEDNEKVFDIIAILRGGESMTYNTPTLIDWLNQIQKKNNWKPSQEQIKALEFLVRSYGESGTLSPYGETLAYSNSLLNDLKNL